MTRDRTPRAAARPVSPRGLCPDCRHVRVVANDRGSTFLRCGLAAADPRFPKYPPQPVLACSGYRR